MKPVCVLALVLGLAGTFAQAQSRIVCEPSSKEGRPLADIWPVPYLSEKGALCFDVKTWSGYAGQNCVTNGGHIAWAAVVIVSVDAESQGRDLTSFRVVKPVVNNDLIQYTLEWSRSGAWAPLQRVKINRLSGDAFSESITRYGGEAFQCHLEKRKL